MLLLFRMVYRWKCIKLFKKFNFFYENKKFKLIIFDFYGHYQIIRKYLSWIDIHDHFIIAMYRFMLLKTLVHSLNWKK